MSKRDGGRGKKPTKDCSYCHSPEHHISECPKLSQKSDSRSAPSKCFNCGQTGHRKNDCKNTSPSGSGDSRSGQPTCFSCGKPGHRSDMCPDFKPKDSQSRSAGPSRSDRRSSDNWSHSGPVKKQYEPSSRGFRDERVGKLEPMKAKELQCISRSKFVKRPDTGKCGQLLELIANHFRLIIKDIVVHHYHFEIHGFKKAEASGGKPTGSESKQKMRKLRQRENRLVFNAFVKQYKDLFKDRETGKAIKHPVFDGNTTVYTAMALNSDSFDCTVNVDIDGQMNEIDVSIKWTQSIDLSIIDSYYKGVIDNVPNEAMQAIDIILRYGPTTNRVPIGNSLYPKWDENSNPNRVDIDRNGNKQVVFGHYQSTRLTKVGPTLLVDRSATAFYTGGSLMSYLSKLFSRNEDKLNIGVREVEHLKRQLKGLRIYTTHLPYKRPYTIKDVSMQTPANTTFQYEENGKTFKKSVKDYYQEKYNKKLNHGDLPCIIPQSSREIFLPLELCHLFPDQPVPRTKLTPDNTSKMVRTCGSQKPVERFNEISEAVKFIERDGKNYLMEFKIEIEDKPLLVPGRVLDKPKIDGLDRQNRAKILRSVDLKFWVCVNLCPRDVNNNQLSSFLKFLTQNASDMIGIRIDDPIKIFTNDNNNVKGIRDLFIGSQEECRRAKGELQMILFIIPDDTDVYTNIKLLGDINYGIATQCVKSKNVSTPPKGGIQANLLLKINAKLGGINRILKNLPDKPSILNEKVMIIGADVTHPAPADRLSSSVAACIGSYDKDHCIYSASIRVQERSTKAQAVEMIKEFDIMIEELLSVYYKHNNSQYPKHIIYYRDGVSESQFKQVLDHELTKLLKGCKKMGFKPNVTFITVQKRHHTRFRPNNPRDKLANQRNGNIPPGTTVDTHVVHPTDYDFYLCSHEGIQGTSRPTHYYVLHDDHAFKADELQKLSYYLCYTYSRCDKPISIPTPVQYAHLAAYRARNHIIACNIKASNGKKDETEEERKLRENRLAQKLNKEIKVNEGIKNRMYYC